MYCLSDRLFHVWGVECKAQLVVDFLCRSMWCEWGIVQLVDKLYEKLVWDDYFCFSPRFVSPDVVFLHVVSVFCVVH